MKKNQILLSCVLSIGILFTACNKSDTDSNNMAPSSPSPELVQKAMDQLIMQGLDVSKPLAGNTKAAQAPFLEASSSYEQGLTFELSAWFNSDWCLSGNDRFTLEFHVYDYVKGTWMYWGTGSNYLCLSDVYTAGGYTLNDDTWVIFYVNAWIVNPSGSTYLGYALSNWVFLDRPW